MNRLIFVQSQFPSKIDAFPYISHLPISKNDWCTYNSINMKYCNILTCWHQRGPPFLHNIKFWSLEVFYKNSVGPNFFYDRSPNFCNFFLLRPLFATLEKDARFSRARNFARARRAPKNFWKKFEFIEGLNICKIRTAGKLLVWPENGGFHEIYRSLARLDPKNHIYFFWKHVLSFN